MMTFVNTCSEGLTILPTHRLAANLHDFSWGEARSYLEPWFEAKVFPFSDDGQKAKVQNKFLAYLHQARPQRAIGVYPAAEPGKRAYYVLTPRRGADLSQLLHGVSPLQRELDVVLLHDGILEPAFGITLQAVTAERNLAYEREASAALDAVDRGSAQIAFLLNPVDVDQGGAHRHQEKSCRKIHGLLSSQTAERHHHVPRRVTAIRKDRRQNPAQLPIMLKKRHADACPPTKTHLRAAVQFTL
jgi:hypothetical protein